MITRSEIRRRFLEYFRDHDHTEIGNSSLIPINDPTLLIVNSGMAPLKRYFTGDERPPSQRLCNIQRCVRTNDVESVGDRHHLTFFEMMGNWSIGDYFKDSAIDHAWQVITKVFAINTDNLYVTVYGEDPTLPEVPADEDSFKAWTRYLPEERIIRLGAKSNFWGPAGTSGPCGPCTEMFIDRGLAFGCGKSTCGPDCDCGRFLEIWNAGVFMQYDMQPDKTLMQLPLRSVDAGAGLDRFAVILQGVDSIYETEHVRPLVDLITDSDANRCNDRATRIMVDHMRCATFMIADGIFPGRAGREYVVRRIIRRSILHAKLTGTPLTRLLEASALVVSTFGSDYPQLSGRTQAIGEILRREITFFTKTLDRGMREFEKVSPKASSMLKGSVAFQLYDAHGLPLELISELATSRGLTIDLEEFQACLDAQRERSRRAR